MILSIFLYVKILIALLAFLNGAICLAIPSLAIQIQQRFYEKLNWKIEPIDLAKEINNTRIMGVISLMLSIAILVSIIK